ncbi:Phytanoyl- dioxygenase [Pyrenophora seminiperda CCB06]|uniref:Phytanoyl-dioxygenase n=1 Tax=Pyrenophora seminiperda CCB06 TaxID=1302712 RepID=A0A3M7MGG6_9PLEO|nr:Phytanoyl- dioxygenase [Pyrenophora seminiperda CCB06]
MMAILERDGGLILKNLVAGKDIASINEELDPYVEEARAKSHAAYDLVPEQTIMVPGTVGKSPTLVKVAELEVIDRLRTLVLQKKCTATWEDRTEEFTIGPLLNSSLTYHISHGAARQRLHRDDMIHGIYHSGEYSLSNETMLGFMIAGSRTTRENGATMAIPGSHKWDHSRIPRPDEVCFAEMEPGDAFVFLGTVYHGAGHNAVVDQVRKVYGLFFIPGTLRPEENQFLAIPRSKVLGMSEKMLSLLGYKKPGTWLGVVNNRDPADDLVEVFRYANE